MVFRLGLCFGLCAALTACASAVPSNFEYKSAVRGERGFAGTAGRVDAVTALLNGGVVTDPAATLQSALPDAEVTVRKWGLRYFGADWARYQVVLDADITRGDTTRRCRKVSTETPVGAPTLNELTAKSGTEFQRHLDQLVAACVRKVG